MEWVADYDSKDLPTIRFKDFIGDSHRVLLRADAHHDNPKCDQDLEKKHLNLATELNAPIIDAGDLFCLMQGKGDPRHSKADIRPEHMGHNYLDLVLNDAADFYRPHRDQFVLIADGNHELKVRKYQETDLTERLSNRLECFHGGYRGFVRFMFEAKAGGCRRSKILYYAHGSGSGGGASKGMQRHWLRSMAAPQADIILSGHIHDTWYMEQPQWMVTSSGKVIERTQYHIQTPTYKRETRKPGSGFLHEKEVLPKPVGAWWMIFTRLPDREIEIKFERAI